MTPAVEETITALQPALAPEDAAAVALARRYAALIDSMSEPKLRSWAMRWIAPLLLTTLESLGATPTARARLKGGKVADAAPSALEKLRQARRGA